MRHSSRVSRDRRGSFLKVLGIGCLVIVILAVVAGIFVAKNIKSIATNMAEAALTTAIEEMEIDQGQKAKLKTQVKQLADGFRDGSITIEQMAEIGEKFATGPIAGLGMLAFAQMSYFSAEDLTEEEKKEAALHIGRYSRGLIEGSITQAQVQKIFDKFTTTDASGNTTNKQSMTPEERAELLELIKADVDAAGISEEEYSVDYGAEFQKIIDEVIGDVDPADGFDEIDSDPTAE